MNNFGLFASEVKNRYSLVFREVFPLMRDRFSVLRWDSSTSLREVRSSAGTLGIF